MNNYQLKDNISSEIQKRLSILRLYLSRKTSELQKAPEGTLRIILNHKRPQYYYLRKHEHGNGQYISSKNRKLVLDLAQRDYNKTMLKALQKQIAFLEQTLARYQGLSLEKVDQNFSPSRKPLIISDFPKASEIAEKWRSVHYARFNDKTLFETERKEYVRSKSEQLIAQALNSHKIPYRYEYPVKILTKDTRKSFTVHPDFYCLNLRSGTEIIWEHFGLMDDPEYAQKAVQKINSYIQNGWLPGRNFIFTAETKENPLTARLINKIITEYLL